MDDATKEAIRQLEELKEKFASAPFDHSEGASLAKQLKRSIIRIFGENTPHLEEIKNKDFYYPRASRVNKKLNFETDRKLFLVHIEQLVNDLRLSGLLPKTDQLEKTDPINQDGLMSVNPLWKGRHSVDNKLVFLVMPFSESWSDGVWETIKDVVEGEKLRCLRGDESIGRDVMEDVWEGICKARVIIADLTAKNPNVMYELGLADAIGKDVILLSQSIEDVPFDLRRFQLVIYQENNARGVTKLRRDLREHLKPYQE